MSGNPAEQSETPVSTDSRLDAILEQLNALGGSTTESRPPNPTQRMLRSVPDLEPETFDDVVDQPIEPPVLEPIAPPPVPNAIEPPPAPPAPPAPVEPIEPANFTFGAPDEPVPVAERPPEMEPLPVAEPMPVVVEYHQPEPVPAPELAPEPEPETPAIPTMFTPPAIPVPEPEVETQELVFELDGPLDVDAQSRDLEAPPVPDASATDLPATPPPLPDSGWVSHHHEPVDAPSEAADTTLAPVEPFESTDTPVSEAAPEANTFDAPQWGEINEDPEVRGEQSNASPFSPLVGESTSESFETDDELPLPDFTGVWEDTTEPTVWDADTDLDGESLPDPVEIASSGSGISVGRNELDSLRPVEEEPKAEAKTEQRLGRKLQLFAVILFGLIALAVVLLNDPAVVEDLREIYDGFFG